MTQQTYIMLTAAEGKILTNGETFGRIVSLGNGDAPENWREVDEAEYTAYLAAEAAKEPVPPDELPQESENGTPEEVEA